MRAPVIFVMCRIGDYSTRVTHVSITFASDAVYQREVEKKN